MHKNVAQAFDGLKNCLDDIKQWLSANKLKLNPIGPILLHYNSLPRGTECYLWRPQVPHRKVNPIVKYRLILLSDWPRD